jgi:hypothetical protein
VFNHGGMSKLAKINLPLRQGATFRKRLQWKSPAGAPIDLTGCTARLQVREEVESPTVLVDLTTENGGITLGGVDGTIDLFVSATATAAYAWESGVHDLEIEHPNGDVTALAYGGASLAKEVTR